MSERSRIHLVLSIFLVAMLACNALLPLGVGNSPTKSSAVAAVALRLDGSRTQLSGFVGPVTTAWSLDPGSYMIRAVDQAGVDILFSQMQIGDVPVIWPQDFASAAGTRNSAQATAILTLVGFLVDAQEAKLTALEASSGGFTVPLFTAHPGQAELDQLYDRYATVLARQSSVMSALDVIVQSSHAEGTPAKMAVPRLDWKENLLGFFGYAGGAGSRARERILKIAENLSPEDQADAFEVLRQGFKGDVTNFDDLAVKLQSGQLDAQAAQMESDMRNAPGFAAAAQEAGVTVGQVMHQEGGELVSKGAELEVEIVKQALGDAFPDITRGFELADKAQEWSDYVESVYKDPLAVAEGEARNAIQEKIKERILEHLGECCASLDDDVAEAIADDLSEQAMDAVPSVVETIQATQTALAANPPVGGSQSGTGASIELRDTLHETLTYPDISNIIFSTTMVLSADHDAGTVAGSLEGVATYDLDFPCTDLFDASVVYERGVASYRLTYSVKVNGTLDPNTGAFSAPLAPAGNIDFIEMIKPYTDSHCTDMNTDMNVNLPFAGTGTIEGVISPTGEARITTDWKFSDQGHVHGSWSGQGQVVP